MFIEIEDLGSSIYNYQVEQITEGDESISIQAIMAAESEMRGYLVANNKREWKDGRLKYDIEKIFSATGSDRNALLVRHCVTIAIWYIVDLCNADFIYEHAKDRYDRAVSWLNKLAKGEVNLDTLPTIKEDDSTTGTTDDISPFIYGSREKFTHE